MTFLLVAVALAFSVTRDKGDVAWTSSALLVVELLARALLAFKPFD